MCETLAGVESVRPVVAHRLLPPWSADPGCLRRFAPIAGEWRHSLNSGLVELLDFGPADETLWVIEEHREGETLRATLTALGQRQAQLLPNEGLAVLLQVLSTLTELHAQGLVHGDVSASTVLLTPSGEVLLRQFGLGLAAGSAPGLGPARSEPECVTPEQLQGGVDATSDVFRVGLMLHELAVGRALFAGPDPLALARAYTAPDPMPTVPGPFVALIGQFLGRSPTARPHSSEALRDLEQLVRSFQFSTTQAEVATLFARAFPSRRPLAPLLAQPGGQTVVLAGDNRAPRRTERLESSEAPTPPERSGAPEYQPAPFPLSPPPPSRSRQSPGVGSSPSGAFSSASPSRSWPPPGFSSPSGAFPSASPPGAGDSGPVALARITTRKVSRSDLRVLKAPENAPAPTPPPPKPMRAGDPRDLRLGDHLQTQGLLTAAQVSEALEYARTAGTTLTDAIITLELLDEDVTIAAMSDLSRTTSISTTRLHSLQPAPETLKLLSLEQALELLVVPLALKGQSQLMVAMRDPADEAVVAQVKRLTGVTSIVGVRASERAIRRTIARCYQNAVDVDLPTWVEPSSASAIFSAPSGLRPAQPLPSATDDDAPLELDTTRRPVTSSQSRVAAAPPPRSSPTGIRAIPLVAEAPQLEEAHLKLLELLLARFGEPGRAALELVGAVTAVGRRLALDADELGRLRYGAAAIAICNLIEGRSPTTTPTSVALAKWLGASWPGVQPVVVPLLEGCSRPVDDLTAAALAATFTLAALTGGGRPSPSEAGAALQTLRKRGCFPGQVLDALWRELAADAR